MRLVRPFMLVVLLCALLSSVPAFAEGSRARYYPQTRHTVSGPFLQFLEERGDVDLLGAPLTESIVYQNRVVQIFERGALRLNPDLTGSLEPLPASLVPSPFPAEAAPATPNDLVQYFPETGHTVGFAILAFYRERGGPATFGYPLTPQIGNAQWFERAKLEWDPAAQRVSLAAIGLELLRHYRIDPSEHESQWVATFEDTLLYAEPSLESSGPSVRQFRSFLQVGSQGDFLRVWDPTRNLYGWLLAAVVGPATEPNWLAGLASATYVGQPGRIAKPIFGQFPDPAPELTHNSPAWIVAHVTADDGSGSYLDEEGNLIPDSIVRLPRPPARYYPGKWIDADLHEPVLLTAYEDDRPVYSALAVKGTGRWPTPSGVYHIWRRVANETMDSSTIGIPLGTPGSYRISGVLFTQYFTRDGAALHYNYWKSNWGYAGSHGCLGMNYDDSKFFWDWASVGTPVVVRY